MINVRNLWTLWIFFKFRGIVLAKISIFSFPTFPTLQASKPGRSCQKRPYIFDWFYVFVWIYTYIRMHVCGCVRTHVHVYTNNQLLFLADWFDCSLLRLTTLAAENGTEINMLSGPMLYLTFFSTSFFSELPMLNLKVSLYTEQLLISPGFSGQKKRYTIHFANQKWWLMSGTKEVHPSTHIWAALNTYSSKTLGTQETLLAKVLMTTDSLFK